MPEFIAIRLWRPWMPEPLSQWVPSGEVIEVSEIEARAMCADGIGEVVEQAVVGVREVAAVVPPAVAVTAPTERRTKKPKRKTKRTT